MKQSGLHRPLAPRRQGLVRGTELAEKFHRECFDQFFLQSGGTDWRKIPIFLSDRHLRRQTKNMKLFSLCPLCLSGEHKEFSVFLGKKGIQV